MLDFTLTKLQNIIVHKVGNKTRDEGIRFSNNYLITEGDILKELLLKYFLSPFKSDSFYRFYHETDINLNEIFVYIKKIFEDENVFIEQSKNISKHLYQQSLHPKIKGGEFYITYLKDCIVDGEQLDAIGLFKTENKDTYLRVHETENNFEVDYESGININKLDKGCLIFNSETENGFVVSIIDNINKSGEAQYWKDDFLKIKPREDNFYFTQNYLKMCKEFTETAIDNLDKNQQIEIKNNALKYFKEKEVFNVKEFADEVIKNPEIKEAFIEHKQNFENDNDLLIQDNFDISKQATNKSQKYFKSVLKLDKNFHLYIHGGHDLIEKGFDEDKKLNYYKLFYDKEI